MHTPLSTLWAAGAGADRIATLSWFLIIASGVIYVIVIATMLLAMFRNRRGSRDDVDLSPGNIRFVSWGGAILPGIILAGIFITSMTLMGAFPPHDPAPQLTIHVTAHQWWWQADYDDAAQHERFTTANELHIPVGVPVRVILTSNDVIHSFWVPRLQGKLDVIPGDTNELRLLAKMPGEYRGQCAEFCGTQHAHMGVVVVAESAARFQSWAATQLAPAAEPSDTLTQLGRTTFLAGPCAECHTVRGTSAHGAVGPDLTHVGGRGTIAAGTMVNTLASVEGWISNPQAIKPGTQMPPNTQFTGPELVAVAAYIGSLK